MERFGRDRACAGIRWPHLRMGRIGQFVVGSAKVAAGIVLSVLVLAGVVWGFTSQQERSRRSTEAPLGTRKDWPPISVSALGGSTFNLATMWRDGQIFYRLTVDGYPREIETVREGSPGRASFTLKFEDSNGFKIHEKKIGLNEMVLMVGEGRPSGLSWSDSEFADADSYRNAASWTVVWAGF